MLAVSTWEDMHPQFVGWSDEQRQLQCPSRQVCMWFKQPRWCTKQKINLSIFLHWIFETLGSAMMLKQQLIVSYDTHDLRLCLLLQYTRWGWHTVSNMPILLWQKVIKMTPYIEFVMLRRTTPGRSYDILPYRYVNARIFENIFFHI
jgi:hypothetical protein